MEPLHIKFNINESLNSKRQLLASQLDLLETLKQIHFYKTLRKEELIKKSKLKIKIKEMKTAMNKLKRNLPKLKIPGLEKQEIKENIQEKAKKIELEDELKEIKERLIKLNK